MSGMPHKKFKDAHKETMEDDPQEAAHRIL